MKNFVLAVFMLVFSCSALFAATVYMKNGEEIPCIGYSKSGGKFYILVNRDVEVDFPASEVDLKKTERHQRKHKPKVQAAAPAKQAVAEAAQAPAASTAPATTSTASPASEGGCPAQKELETIYAKLVKAGRAGDIDGQMKYAAEKGREGLKKAKSVPGGLGVKLLQAAYPENYTVTGCSVAPDGKSASLSVKGKMSFLGESKSDSDGTISFVMEGKEWKVSLQSWNGGTVALKPQQ